MEIKSRGYGSTFVLIFFISLVFLFFFIVYSDIKNIGMNSDAIILLAFSLLSCYLTYYLFALFKAQNYKIKMDDVYISYSFFRTRTYRYSDISRMFWTTLEVKSGGVLNILKLKFNNGASLILCVDKIGKDERDYIITTLRSKVRRDFNCREWKFLSR